MYCNICKTDSNTIYPYCECQRRQYEEARCKGTLYPPRLTKIGKKNFSYRWYYYIKSIEQDVFDEKISENEAFRQFATAIDTINEEDSINLAKKAKAERLRNKPVFRLY